MDFFLRMTHSPRAIYGVIFLSCVALLGMGYYMEYAKGLIPCPLCMAQRLFYMGLGVVALLGVLHGSRGILNRINAFFALLFAVGGATIAGRQVWLQHLPADQVPSCGADFDFIVSHFPLLKAIETLWQGSGDCAEVQWQFLGLSIAGWSLVWFVFFTVIALYLLIRRFPAQ
ncbi:disulfide bond formation protein B [Thioflexithrix psekupsensis]|uniref:Disulfide bond formation protein B n=1 Tax=Thioflexithrix psekupsensis TaxID=1570016 RepID=A0A251X9M0_9GAMM|nr:disulfide bond formation protein B [Thioflexithrix psekupsensis]OUD14494.1 disulfide bond formation protein B [Thioflexithrix psekupsensis]